MGAQTLVKTIAFALLILAAGAAQGQYKPSRPAGSKGCGVLQGAQPSECGPGGFRDKRIGSNRWLVRVYTNSYETHRRPLTSEAQNIAIYRAAILSKAGGYDYMKVVDFENWLTQATTFGESASAKIVVEGTNSNSDPLICEAKPRFASNCQILRADAVIKELQTMLDRTPNQAIEEVENVRRSGYQR
jgi:hypothetical protein